MTHFAMFALCVEGQYNATEERISYGPLKDTTK